MSGRVPLKKRLEKDENFMMKILSEVGDVCRFYRGLEAQVKKLTKRVERLERNAKHKA